MTYRIQCSECKRVFTGCDEYTAEVKWNRHRCPVKVAPMKRADNLVTGDVYRLMDDRAQPTGGYFTVTGPIKVGPGATHLSQMGTGKAKLATVEVPTDCGVQRISVLTVVSMKV